LFRHRRRKAPFIERLFLKTQGVGFEWTLRMQRPDYRRNQRRVNASAQKHTKVHIDVGLATDGVAERFIERVK